MENLFQIQSIAVLIIITATMALFGYMAAKPDICPVMAL